MAFTKYASFEVSEILDIKGSSDKSRRASLDKFSDFEDYRTEDGFLYARIRAISSRVNKNHDGWPSVELAGSEDVFKLHQASLGGFVVEANQDAKYGYSTFVGKPIFVDHNNSNPERARGVIVDAKLHVEDHKISGLDPYYASAPDNHMPPTWVELLLEVDAKSFPKLAKAIIEGSKDASKGIDGFSMGCDVEKSVCNICKNSATAPDEYCEHIRMKGATFNYINPKTGKKEARKSYEDCYGIKFFEISAVFDPADETALLRELVHKEGAGPNLNYDPQSQSFPNMTRTLPHPNEGPGSIEHECPNCGAPDTAFDDFHNPEGPVNWQRNCQHCGEVFQPLLHEGAERPRLIDEPCPDCFGQGWRGPNMEDCPTCSATGRMNGNAGALPQGEGYNTPIQFRPQDANVDLGMHQTQLRTPNYGHIKIAENPPPQSELIHAPENIDTLREEKVCPVCGSTMEDEACDICGYIEPPEGFDNPDLEKAREMENETTKDQGLDQDAIVNNTDQNPGQLQNTPPPSNAQPLSHINREMGWTAKLDPKLTGRINTIETPIKPGNGPVSDEPVETIINDETQPVTSSVRTAEQILTAVGRNKENLMSNRRVAADPAPGAENNSQVTMDHDHKRVDVTGVGGVDEASNEEASKADAQIDLEGRGATPVKDVSSDSSEGLPTAGKESDDAGYNTDKITESIPTKTWSGEDGQHDPVSSDPFPASDEGVKSSGWKIHALDSGPYPSEDGGLGGGSTTKGVSPADPIGNAEDRVDVLDSTTTPSNNSGPTKTWNGTDGNGVLKQQEPVTTEVFAPWSSHVVASLKLADLEVELGLLGSESRYERLAELQESSLEEVTSALSTLQKVKTAGLTKRESKSGRLPSLTQPPPHMRQASTDEDPLMGTLFGV